MNNQEKYAVLGLMSGSSLDGLDMALCEFQREVDGGWSGRILKTETRPFPIQLLEKLKSLPLGTALELAEADFAFSVFSSGCVLDFLV
ncbi:MAG TPA: anhydro-N-acetylmuramic acid kinase, partial [Catalimonadaceae bacterium]|nr:anhydro-N-acetylmuramic acid kinase [Catalimonadaceae bacterium]